MGEAVGDTVGDGEGAAVGLGVGCKVGAGDGDPLGAAVGDGDGTAVGATVGLAVGVAVGAGVGVAVGSGVHGGGFGTHVIAGVMYFERSDGTVSKSPHVRSSTTTQGPSKAGLTSMTQRTGSAPGVSGGTSAWRRP